MGELRVAKKIILLLTVAISLILFANRIEAAQTGVSEDPATMQFTGDIYALFGYSVNNIGDGFDHISSSNQMLKGGYAQGFVTIRGPFELGLELGYSYYLWYWQKYYNSYLNITNWYYTQYNSWRVLALGRANFGKNWIADIGAGYLFGLKDFEVMGEFGYKIHFMRNLSVPIKFRIECIFESPVIIPLGASVGISYDFSKL